jgi:hypothetical protein
MPRFTQNGNVLSAHLFMLLFCAFGLSGCEIVAAQCEENTTVCDLIAQLKCGENGTVDWDENLADPPPHCG